MGKTGMKRREYYVRKCGKNQIFHTGGYTAFWIGRLLHRGGRSQEPHGTDWGCAVVLIGLSHGRESGGLLASALILCHDWDGAGQREPFDLDGF